MAPKRRARTRDVEAGTTAVTIQMKQCHHDEVKEPEGDDREREREQGKDDAERGVDEPEHRCRQQGGARSRRRGSRESDVPRPRRLNALMIQFSRNAIAVRERYGASPRPSRLAVAGIRTKLDRTRRNRCRLRSSDASSSRMTSPRKRPWPSRPLPPWPTSMAAPSPMLHVIVPFYVPADVPFGLAADTIPSPASFLPEQRKAPRGAGRQTLGKGSTKVTCRVDIGDASQCILDAARRADSIVMSTHGRSGLTHLLIGSVAGEGRAARDRPGAHDSRSRQAGARAGREDLTGCGRVRRAALRAADRALLVRRRVRDRPAACSHARRRGGAPRDARPPCRSRPSGLRHAAGPGGAREAGCRPG